MSIIGAQIAEWSARDLDEVAAKIMLDRKMDATDARHVTRAARMLERYAIFATRGSEIPAELFDGMAVYVALGEKSGVSHRDVAAVLDAVVRLIRANRG